MNETPLAYFWGEDAFSIERAARTFAERIAPPGEQMETWRASLDDDSGEERATANATRRRARTLDGIEQHLGMAPLFGAGTLVVIRQPAGLLAEKASRERLLALVATVPPGNALCITDLTAAGARSPLRVACCTTPSVTQVAWSRSSRSPARGSWSRGS